MRSTMRLINNGKVTVPAQIRDALDVKDGDLIEIDVQPVAKQGEKGSLDHGNLLPIPGPPEQLHTNLIDRKLSRTTTKQNTGNQINTPQVFGPQLSDPKTTANGQSKSDFNEFSPFNPQHYQWSFVDLRRCGALISLRNNVEIKSIPDLNRRQAAMIGYPIAFLIVLHINPHLGTAITLGDLMRRYLASNSD